MPAKHDKDVKAKAIRLVRMCKIGSIPQLKPRAQNRLGSWPGRGCSDGGTVCNYRRVGRVS